MGERDPRKQPGLGTAFTQQPRGQIALLPLVATSQTALREGKLLPSSASRLCSVHTHSSQPKQTGNVQQFQALPRRPHLCQAPLPLLCPPGNIYCGGSWNFLFPGSRDALRSSQEVAAFLRRWERIQLRFPQIRRKHQAVIPKPASPANPLPRPCPCACLTSLSGCGAASQPCAPRLSAAAQPATEQPLRKQSQGKLLCWHQQPQS